MAKKKSKKNIKKMEMLVEKLTFISMKMGAEIKVY